MPWLRRRLWLTRLLLTLALVCSPLVLSAMATVLVDAKTIKLSWKPRIFVFGLAYAVGGACLIFACWALLLVSAFFPPLWACGWLVLVALSLLGPVDIFFGYFAMLVFPALFVNFGIMYCVSLPLLFFTGIFWTPLVALVWCAPHHIFPLFLRHSHICASSL